MTKLTSYQCGADAYDAGIGHDAHGLPGGHPNIDQWQQGWRDRRDAVAQARYDRLTRPQAQAVSTTPPSAPSRSTRIWEEMFRAQAGLRAGEGSPP